MFGPYSRILRAPHVRSRLGAVFLSSMPLGMLSLAIVLCAHEWTGELRAAGLLSGLFGLGNAVGLTLQGWLVDRRSARTVILMTGSTCSSALLGFVAAGVFGAPLWVVAAAGGVAGLSVPAITAAVRSWLPGVFADDGVRGTSYALLSALFRGAVTLGPLLVSAAMVLGGPEIAVVLAALLIMAATCLFSFAGPRTAAQKPAASAPGEDSGTFLTPGLLTLLVSAGFIGFAVGVIAVAVPGVMTSAGASVLAGLAFAALALGELLAALGFGARNWPGQRRTQLLVAQPLVACMAVLVFLAGPHPWFLVLVMFAAGVVRAPVSILQSSLLDDVTPKTHLGRSYSALVAVTLVSHAAGSAAAGVLADRAGAHQALLAPVITLLLASLWIAMRYPTLKTSSR